MNNEELLAQLRHNIYVFLEAQFKVLAAQSFANELRLAEHKDAWKRAEFKFFTTTRCANVLQYGARAYLFSVEAALGEAGEAKRELLEGYPDLELTDEEWAAKELFDRTIGTMGIEEYSLLAVLWRNY